MNAVRVLVVSDAPSARVAVRTALRTLGDHRLMEAGSARSAWALATTPGFQFDLILFDLRLPFREGVAVVRAFAQRHRAAAVVLTGAEIEPRLGVAGRWARRQGVRVLGTVPSLVTTAHLAPLWARLTGGRPWTPTESPRVPRPPFTPPT